MIHVLNYEENIIEDLSFKQDAIYEAEHNLNVQDMMETFDFTVASKIAGNLRDRNRIIIQDHMGIYREFIVETIIDLEDGTTEIQSNASYLNDITTAKPLKPKKFTKEMPTVILDYILADTGWEVADDSEVPGDFTIEWDKVIDRAEALKILQEETDMRLTYFIEVSGNKVNKRYVSIKKVDPLFNGEEIVYEDNLIGLKREIDFSEVATALLGVGPEESDDGNKKKERLYVEVVDDKAQEQFGLPQRYIWDYYEVPTESDEKVTEKLLRQRTKKELDERKKASVVYEVSSNAINAQVGDMIRVKDEHIVPEIYLEAEIIEINYDLLSKTKEYKFGILREFTRDQIYRQFNKFREELEKRLKDAVSNTDSIISERLEEELKYVERYIEKSPTPPLNPKEGQLWLDTSHDGVAVLKRYENGEWIKSSVTDVKEIGGMTREETMFEALKERLSRNEVDYSEVFKRHGALVSEKHYHYVDEDIKNDLTNRYNSLQQSYDDFKIAFNNINTEQPTIGLITTAISRAVEFEARLKEYNDSYYIARKAFDEVFGILQSQYSDEKYSDAMQELAEQIGGEWNGNELVVDGKVHEKFYDVRNELERQDDLLKNTIDETEYISDELSKSQSALEQYSHELNTKVGYTEMNGTQQTLEKLLTEFSQTADGFNFRIDSNGMIKDLTFDRNRFKLNSNLIEFNDGDVVIKDGRTTIKDAYIRKLVSDDAFIQNAEITKLVSRDKTNVLTVDNGLLSLSRADMQGYKLDFYSDGIKMLNQNGDVRMRLDNYMVTSAALGTSNSNVYLATDTGFEARIVDRNELPGGGLVEDYTYRPIRASVYRFPDQSLGYFTILNGGEFRFTGEQVGPNRTYQPVRAAGFYGDFLDANTGDNMYIRTFNSSGEVRFTVRNTTNNYVDLRGKNIWGTSFITNSTHAYVGADGELRVVNKGLSGLYRDVRAAGYYGAFLETTATNMYVRASNEVRFTRNGTTGTYIPIRFSEWTATSHEKYKHDIEEWNYNVLDVFKNDLKLHRYKFNSDLNTEYDRYRHGIVIRENSANDTFPIEWRNGDGFDGNEVMWWNTKAIQELAHENDELKSEIKELNNKIDKIMEMIA